MSRGRFAHCQHHFASAIHPRNGAILASPVTSTPFQSPHRLFNPVHKVCLRSLQYSMSEPLMLLPVAP